MRCEKCGKEYPSRYYFRTKTICTECFGRLSPAERREVVLPKGIYRHSTTAFTIDGYRIKESLGVVRGITVRSRSIFGTLGASLQTIIGGNITLFTELCEKTRGEAFDMMVEHAEEIGANAVVGVRYDANEVMSGVTEVLCYGTAVVLEPNSG
ncbi:MAG: heavy metal-binding domain-containing protein [Bacteroidetes bacterium]|nr:heavy metal-binding domain-containing protein [Bacteroidota bacterium]